MHAWWPQSRARAQPSRAIAPICVSPSIRSSRTGRHKATAFCIWCWPMGRRLWNPCPCRSPGCSWRKPESCSEHIELEMKPGGREVQEIRAPSNAQVEFLPNRPDQSHRTLTASRIRIFYGNSSYIDRFEAWNVFTHTDKPASAAHPKSAPGVKQNGPAPPALTWSDDLIATFTPNSNQISTIEQTGHFRYQEGVRKASANRAFFEQSINRMTLTGNAHVSDDSGSAMADTIVMNQATGDMDASGRVVSTHNPDPNQKPGTSVLDATKTMQAKADRMQTRDNNTKVRYEGHVVMWQGANRIAADAIDIDRDAETLHASGNVVSELVIINLT